MTSESQLAKTRHLSQMLLSAADLSREIFAEIAQDIGVRVHIARALCALEDASPMSELAAALACDKSYITPLADEMESLNLVNRVPGKDRRTKLLALTEKGVSVREALEAQIVRRSPVMVSLNAEERGTLEGLLAKLNPPIANSLA